MKKKKHIGSWIVFALLLVLYALYLEVYKNQIWGWAIGLIIFVCYAILKVKQFQDKKFLVRLGGFAVLIFALVLNAFISQPREKQVPASSKKLPYTTEEIAVTEGKLVGLLDADKGVEIYTGIPYAAPPVGELRWKEPQAPAKWDGVRKCDTFAPMAMQQRSNPIYAYGSRIVGYNEIPFSLKDNYIEAMSEDCLYLNVYRPEGAKEGDKLPVLFYVHGGSLNSGQSYFEAYNGEKLASQGIIVVNIAYRVGVFGYMADDELMEESPNHTTGNYGLLDQIQALKWVNENIASFGGDVSNITIAGESAGASSVNAICVSPLAKGLFRRAIAESSGITPKVPYHTFRNLDYALSVGQSIEEELDCETIDELRQIPADKLVNTKGRNNEMTVDGYAITEQPYLTYEKGNNNEEAILGGFNGNEAEVFMMFDKKATLETYEDSIRGIAGTHAKELTELWPASDDKDAAWKKMELIGAAWFGYSHYSWSELMAAQDKPCYLYFFNKDNKSLGTWHAGELPYFYGNLKHNGNYDESDYALSDTIQGYILNYVRTGNPNGEGLPQWDTYNEKPNQYLQLDSQVEMTDNKYLEVFHLLNQVMEER